MQIVKELNDAQGTAIDLGGYYLLNDEKVATAMRPSATLNHIINGMLEAVNV
jgi:isocitrate dehydrogenase